jgi:8-oxo-dGTP pyrophosphatase MutT (NUDIX family)
MKGCSCGAVICRERKFLLLKKKLSGNWEAPKGRREKKETEHQAARREVFEETQLKNLRFFPRFRATNKYSIFHQGNKIPKEDIFFLAESTEGDVVLSDEHIEFEWLNFEESIERIKFKNLKTVLIKAAQRLDPEFVPPKLENKKE